MVNKTKDLPFNTKHKEFEINKINNFTTNREK